MLIFEPNNNIENNSRYGQVINKIFEKYIKPELDSRRRHSYVVAFIEVDSKSITVLLDDEVQMFLETKNKKFKPSDVDKNIALDLKEIKNIKFGNRPLKRASAKLLVIRFNKDWWILKADFGKQDTLKEDLKISITHNVRLGSYLPLSMRRQEKDQYYKQWRNILDEELPGMWKRYITVSQRYRGTVVFDGNYYDLFMHANDLYILGYYYDVVVICRAAAEQALISILINSGKGFDIHKKNRNGNLKQKSIEDLVETCRNRKLMYGKFLINKASAKKLIKISEIASDLVHLKFELKELDSYKPSALICMDNLYYVIKNNLNFVKKTGVVSGYKFGKFVKRLR